MTIPQLVFDGKFSGELTRTSFIVIGCIFVDFLVDSRIFNLLFQHDIFNTGGKAGAPEGAVP